MNPRRVHELMSARFTTAGAADADWTNLVDEHGLLMDGRARVVLLAHFVERGVQEVLVEVHRKVGAQLPIDTVIPYIQSHICHSDIRIANREFTVFAEVAINGVGRGWHALQ